MTATTETGRHVTPERIRRGRELMEDDGFDLEYECPLELLGGRVVLRCLRAMHYDDSEEPLQFSGHLSDYSCRPPGPPRQT